MGTMTSHCLDHWDLPYSESYVAWGGEGFSSSDLSLEET